MFLIVLDLHAQGFGWEAGRVRELLQGLIDKHSDVAKTPPFVYEVLKAAQESVIQNAGSQRLASEVQGAAIVQMIIASWPPVALLLGVCY